MPQSHFANIQEQFKSFFTSSSNAMTYSIGDKVAVMQNSFLKNDAGELIADVWPGQVLPIQDIRNKHIELSRGKPGWLERSAVVPLHMCAIDLLTAKIQADPENARLYAGRGYVWQQLNVTDCALNDMNEAIRLDPQDARNFDLRGLLWFLLRDYERALSDSETAMH
jgi:tetratricopeptide (TPR) repeat protein